MPQDVGNYDPGEVSVVWGEVIEGFADGTFVTVLRDQPTFRDKKGCDGEVTRLFNKDTRGTIQFILQQTSDSHRNLLAKANLDELLGYGVFPFIILDKSGKRLAFAAQAWVLEYPKQVYSKGIEGWSWAFKCTGLRFVGI
jgi:hypothetical protein